MSAPLVQKLASFGFCLIALALMMGSGAANQETNSATRQNPPTVQRKLKLANPPSMRPDSTVAITAVRNLNSEHWPQDLEVVVRNNFPRPIYYLEVILRLPEISTELDGIQRTYAVPLTYGRQDLWKLDNLATSEDVPINPGEVIGLKLPEHYWKGLESHLARRNIPTSSIKTIQLAIDIISFGDGTGMQMGEMVKAKQRSSNNLDPRSI